MKLLYLVSEDWYFVSHRLALAVKAKDAGYDVVVVARVNQHGDAITKAGLRLVPVNFDRRSRNPLTQLAMLWALLRIYFRERPDIVHHVALKPVVYGTVVARMARVPHVVNAVAGLGWLFSSRGSVARLASGVFRRLLVPLLNGGVVIVQNPDDREFLNKCGVRDQSLRLIRGAGVDLADFSPGAEPDGIPIVVLASRMLREKGVAEFVDAAEILRQRAVPARFVLVGEPDAANPASIPEQTLASWREKGLVEWWGRRSDMPAVLAGCAVFCLPSYYGEGIPKVLLEAAASSRPIVTTDSPGCREVVRHGDNGFLVRPRDAVAIADALQPLIEHPDLRRSMGQRGRERAVAEFGVDHVIAQTLAIYGELA